MCVSLACLRLSILPIRVITTKLTNCPRSALGLMSGCHGSPIGRCAAFVRGTSINSLQTFMGLEARLLLGTIFILAGSSKLRSPLATRRMVALLWPMESDQVKTIVHALALVELLVGLALALGLFAALVALLAMVLLAAFASAIVIVLLVWGEQECGCFGELGTGSKAWIGAIRNVVLMAFALTAMQFGSRGYSVDGVLSGGSAAIGMWPPITNLVLAAFVVVLCIGGYHLAFRRLAGPILRAASL